MHTLVQKRDEQWCIDAKLDRNGRVAGAKNEKRASRNGALKQWWAYTWWRMMQDMKLLPIVTKLCWLNIYIIYDNKRGLYSPEVGEISPLNTARGTSLA